ncbi:hypothetical protein [Vineibacter terrae]|uniref:hypothetical protein n=1 Tax=Vineibacter terrae TaxID=2586908 RepID=UPI002E3296FF|nr:hypothetical protein [Vineibacter terrae]HEX2888452.1 hypothetical protein [Vineibacter terrae]
MSFLRHGLYWTDHLRWYQRVCLVLWWLGVFLFMACLAIAVALLYMTRLERSGVQSALAVALLGIALLIAARALLAMATRRARRRSKNVY